MEYIRGMTLEDQLREAQNNDYIEGKAVHLFQEAGGVVALWLGSYVVWAAAARAQAPTPPCDLISTHGKALRLQRCHKRSCVRCRG